MPIIYTEKELRPRDGREFYPTQLELVESALDYLHIPAPARILDPGAGAGIWGEEARKRWPDTHIMGIDKYFPVGPACYDTWWVTDFLTTEIPYTFDLIIGNPPYRLDWPERFARKSYHLLKPGGTLLFVMEASFSHSQQRANHFWPDHPPVQVVLLSERPSFTGDGKTNEKEYNLYIWQKGYTGSTQTVWGFGYRGAIKNPINQNGHRYTPPLDPPSLPAVTPPQKSSIIEPRPIEFEPGQSIISITGDCVEELARFPEKVVNSVVTSPPYYGLRNYQLERKTAWPEIRYSPMPGFQYFTTTIPAQTCWLGLEDTQEAYIGHLVHVFRLVRRVLRDDGTVWLNIGDNYAGNNTSKKSNEHPSRGQKDRSFNPAMTPARYPCLPRKNLYMFPARIALALQADSWYIRSEIIWYKPDAHPESVQDRPTKAHEIIYLLSKQPSYWYDGYAIRERTTGNTHSRGTKLSPPKEESNAAAGNGHKDWAAHTPDTVATRNKRTVWHVLTGKYPKAHFATYPPELIEPCILAGTPPKVCAECGAPYKRDLEFGPVEDHPARLNRKKGAQQFNADSNEYGEGGTLGRMRTVTTKGWSKTCDCDTDQVHPGIVLDPFAGSGTTGRVAVQHRRHAILIDLSENYAELQRDRTEVQPFLGI